MLKDIVKFFINATYVPELFPALRIEIVGKISGATYTISLFDSGRIQSTGGVMPREAGIAMKSVIKRLRNSLSIDIKFKNFQVHNMLCIANMCGRIDLAKLKSISTFASDYQPSKFPALRICVPILAESTESYSQNNSKDKESDNDFLYPRKKKRKIKSEQITASIFSNGKISFVGGKSLKSVQYAIKQIRPLLDAVIEKDN